MCKAPAAVVTLCKLTHGMHIAAGTLWLILLAASDKLLRDMQIIVHGYICLYTFCDDGPHTAQHDQSTNACGHSAHVGRCDEVSASTVVCCLVCEQCSKRMP